MVEDMLAARDIIVSHQTVGMWAGLRSSPSPAPHEGVLSKIAVEFFAYDFNWNQEIKATHRQLHRHHSLGVSNLFC